MKCRNFRGVSFKESPLFLLWPKELTLIWSMSHQLILTVSKESFAQKCSKDTSLTTKNALLWLNMILSWLPIWLIKSSFMKENQESSAGLIHLKILWKVWTNSLECWKLPSEEIHQTSDRELTNYIPFWIRNKKVQAIISALNNERLIYYIQLTENTFIIKIAINLENIKLTKKYKI